MFQDFYATVYLAGLAAACAKEADVLISDRDAEKNLKYRKKSSHSRTISKLRNQFWHILLEPSAVMRDQLLEQLCQDIAARPESVRPDRSPLHKSPRNKSFPMAKKAVLP